MMNRKHPHRITYWKKGLIDRHGVPSWDGPYTAYVRWEDSDRVYWTENGREIRGRSFIYADEDILTNGDYAIFAVSCLESPPNASYEVKMVRRITNIRGTKTEYRYSL